MQLYARQAKTLLSLVVGKCAHTRRVSEEIEEKREAILVTIVRSTVTREAAHTDDRIELNYGLRRGILPWPTLFNTRKDAIPHEPVSLPPNTTFVFDADEQNSLVHLHFSQTMH